MRPVICSKKIIDFPADIHYNYEYKGIMNIKDRGARNPFDELTEFAGFRKSERNIPA
jgi:hypothetical protein